MLKAKRGGGSHRSRTTDEAIKDVKKDQLSQINLPIPKNIRKKFKRAAEDNDSNMTKELLKFVYKYIDENQDR
jgi:ribosomal protein S20